MNLQTIYAIAPIQNHQSFLFQRKLCFYLTINLKYIFLTEIAPTLKLNIIFEENFDLKINIYWDKLWVRNTENQTFFKNKINFPREILSVGKNISCRIVRVFKIVKPIIKMCYEQSTPCLINEKNSGHFSFSLFFF